MQRKYKTRKPSRLNRNTASPQHTMRLEDRNFPNPTLCLTLLASSPLKEGTHQAGSSSVFQKGVGLNIRKVGSRPPHPPFHFTNLLLKQLMAEFIFLEQCNGEISSKRACQWECSHLPYLLAFLQKIKF